MAEEVLVKTRSPLSLYDLCMSCYVSNLDYKVDTLTKMSALRTLPSMVLADIFDLMSCSRKLRSILEHQLGNLKTFVGLIRSGYSRQKMFRCVSCLSKNGALLIQELQSEFNHRYELHVYSDPCYKTDHKLKYPEFETETELMVDVGMRLGSFLAEGGWIMQSISVLRKVANRLMAQYELQDKKLKNETNALVQLDCLQRLIHSEATLCCFKSAELTFNIIGKVMAEIRTEKIPSSLLANIYTQFSALFFARSEYDSSYSWSTLAMKTLDRTTSERTVIDVIRQAAKACVVKREFKRANLLICQALHRSEQTFGKKHQKTADVYMDYAFFLLNVDSVYQSVIYYKNALTMRSLIFGDRNFHVAVVHEDLSYAYYVQDYSSGNFLCARQNVEQAVDIMKDLVPSNNLKLASAKRVKALLLEEIALDLMSVNGAGDEGLLKESEELHQCALQLSLEAFGEINVQTAKHYGNLGRLYQTMSRYEEAERMHQRAIKIKTELLGPYDYEVGLSIGHLASLYNYHMHKYHEAEELYLRSIEISLRLFGAAYSGLEYDYLGLCHIYETLREFEKYLKYAAILETWQSLRLANSIANRTTYPEIKEDSSIEELTTRFFNMSVCNTS